MSNKVDIILTGTGRCATGFYSKYLTSAGLNVGHESLFNLGSYEAHHRQSPHLRGDASWLAAPHLGRFPSAFIVHLVRHPKRYMESELNLGAFTNPSYAAYLDFTRRHIPGIDRFDKPIQKSAYRYIYWNKLIEPHANLRFQIEREPRVLFDELVRAGFVLNDDDLFGNRTYNARSGKPVVVTLQEIGIDQLRRELLEVTEQYGYAWSDDTPYVIESPVIKAVVTSMDNLGNLRESIPVLRGDPLISEIIVVNQESKDGTRKWLDEQTDIAVIHRQNDGAGPGRNAGIDRAGEFDFLLTVDGGMRPLRGGTEKMLRYLHRHPGVDLIAPDWHDLETNYDKAWRRWHEEIDDTRVYRNQVLSMTHYALSRSRAWNEFRFAQHGPFGEPGWGCDDDELAHRWNDAGIVVHAAQDIKVYRRASGSFRRLFQETGIWPNQFGSVYEKRLVWMQQNQPHHGKGIQWREPWLTVVVRVGGVDRTARLIKKIHDKMRTRHWDAPWQHIPEPYSIVAWRPSEKFVEWAEPRRLRQHHGSVYILDEYGANREIVRRSETNEATWTGDFRVWMNENWREAVRPNAHYYGLVESAKEFNALFALYEQAHPFDPDHKESPKARQEWLITT